MLTLSCINHDYINQDIPSELKFLDLLWYLTFKRIIVIFILFVSLLRLRQEKLRKDLVEAAKEPVVNIPSK